MLGQKILPVRASDGAPSSESSQGPASHTGGARCLLTTLTEANGCDSRAVRVALHARLHRISRRSAAALRSLAASPARVPRDDDGGQPDPGGTSRRLCRCGAFEPNRKTNDGDNRQGPHPWPTCEACRIRVGFLDHHRLLFDINLWHARAVAA